MPETTLADRLAAIEAAPKGMHVAAYFDFDGTVIDGYSAMAFYRHRLLNGGIPVPELLRTVALSLRGVETSEDFSALLELSLGSWRGLPVDEVEALGREIFRAEIAGRLHREMWDVVQAHLARGHRVVLASSATRYQVQPMADELGAHAVLCTELEAEDGALTGRVQGATLWGDGKAYAVRADIANNGVDAALSFAYSNGDEDVPFLLEVGNPVAVSPADGLRRTALHRGWPVLDCARRPGAIPGVGDLVRTAGFYAGMIGSIGAAVGIGLLNRSRRQAVDLSAGIGGDVGLALAGVDVEVVGSEHLVAARPCVFVFNHQSNLDVPIMMKILRGGFTGVAKAEAAAMPLWGQFFRFADVAFVDRGNSEQARKALEPAVRRLVDDGISLALSPEGTRTPTPRLAPFKKGAFHIAMQAGVPIVPIVLRNVGEVMARSSRTIHPGTVQVQVLPPVPTDRWSAETIDEHVAEVRDMFEKVLTTWR